MIKPDRWIRAWAESGGVDPYEPAQVNSASFDVRLSDHWICPTRDPEEFSAPHIKLFPGEVVLASTLEYVRIPRSVACDLKLPNSGIMKDRRSSADVDRNHGLGQGRWAMP